MPIGFKAVLRDLLPFRAQVPVKYWYDRARGSLEPEMRLLQHLIQKGDRVIDVGGNRGVYAYHCWRLGGIVEVFEPNPVCLRVLEAWARKRPRVTIHPVALSDHAGSAVLHIPIDNEGVEHDASASLEQHGFSHDRDQLITLAALDSYQFDDVKFIKIDVEGHEFSSIEGASHTLSTFHPGLLVEVEQRHCVRPIGEVFAKVLGHNYRGYFLENETLQPLHEFVIKKHQAIENFDRANLRYINMFLFVHEDRCKKGEYRGLEPLGLKR